MSVEMVNLTALTFDEVEPIEAEQIARLEDAIPDVRFRGGPAQDAMIHPAALLEAALRRNLDRWLAANSPLKISQDPTLADPEVVDSTLSNWGLTRKPGTFAVGEIMIVRATSTSVTIPAGAEYEANGVVYRTTQAYAGKSEEALILDPETDRLIEQLREGEYGFTIVVQAETEGEDGRLHRNDRLTPAFPLSDFLRAYAVADFTGGAATETNAELLSQMRAGRAIQTLSNPTTMDAWLRAQSAFSRVVRHSVVRYGDGELTRADRSLFPIKVGGRCDWYVRFSATLFLQEMTGEARLISRDDDGRGLWRLRIPADALPGFYFPRYILPSSYPEDSKTGFEIVESVDAIELPTSGFIPDVTTGEEAAYSAYSARTVTVRDDGTLGDYEIGDDLEFRAELVGQDGVASLQSEVNRPSVRAEDCLVKAPIPCFVAVNLVLDVPAGSAAPATDSIRQQVQSAIHAAPFAGKLYRNVLIDAVHDLLPTGASVREMAFDGLLRRPNGTDAWLTGRDVLLVPDEPDFMVSEKTVQFFCELNDVVVAVRTVYSAD